MAESMAEAREKLDIVSALEEVRGRAEPSSQMVLDGMSALLAGARGAERIYQQYSRQTSDPTLKKKWQGLTREASGHAQIVERAISALGGDPSYKSPVARDLERYNTCMLQVEAQGDAGDLVRLGNLVMLAHICQRQCEGLGNLARQVKDPGMAKILWDASDILEREEDTHVMWNTAMYDDYFMKVVAGI
jgi:hypothetical protein